MSTTFAAWRAEFRNRSFRVRALTTLGALPFALAALATFLVAVEQRPGAVLADPLLAMYPPAKLTWITFSFIYIGIFAGVFILARHPRRLITAVLGYIIMVAMRIVMMYLTPLDPPIGAITLDDPFVEFFGRTGVTLTRDLFFSGHTSTLFLLALAVPERRAKWIFLTCTIGVAICVLWQHVHYSVDVAVAPLAAYTAYRIASAIVLPDMPDARL